MFEHENFHCLRDFYWLCKHIGKDLNMHMDTDEKFYKQIFNYIDSNFSGYRGNFISREDKQMIKTRSNIIMKHSILKIHEEQKAGGTDFMENLTNKKRNIEEILERSITNPDNRFLMLFVKNEFCKNMAKRKIMDIVSKRVWGRQAPSINLQGSYLNFDHQSSTFNKKLLKTLKIYIQFGYTIFMEDLDSIYTILYDLFNQNFVTKNNRKYTKITYEDKEEVFPVHENFRCVIIKSMEEIDESNRIEQRLPSPLLNRMEKHIIEESDFKNEYMINIFMNINQHLENIVEDIQKKIPTISKVKVNLNDLIFCYNGGELVQSLLLELNGNGPLSDNLEVVKQQIIQKIIGFFSFKMLVAYCLYTKEEKKKIAKIKQIFKDTHKYYNLRSFYQDSSKKNDSQLEHLSRIKGIPRARVYKSVVMTSSNYYSTNFSQLKK